MYKLTDERDEHVDHRLGVTHGSRTQRDEMLDPPPPRDLLLQGFVVLPRAGLEVVDLEPGVHPREDVLEAAVVVDGHGWNETKTGRLVDDVEVRPTEGSQWDRRGQLDGHQVQPRTFGLVPDLNNKMTVFWDTKGFANNSPPHEEQTV